MIKLNGNLTKTAIKPYWKDREDKMWGGGCSEGRRES